MGLDMHVRKINSWEKKDLQKMMIDVLRTACEKTLKVNNADSFDPNSFDIEQWFLENPTTTIPYSVGEEICYWRKHSDLHGWMRDLFYEKGGTSEYGFNHDCVILTKDDILRLKLDLIERKLAPTSGFFFGQSYATEEDIEYRMNDDMEKIDLMLQAIEDKATIYYTSSW